MPELTPPHHDDFLDHNDTPSTYTGQANKNVSVNAGEDALEFTSAAGGGDVTGPAASTDNMIARHSGVGGKTLQDYTSNPPTVSDTGDVNVDGDLDVENIVASGTVDGRDVSADGTKLDGVEALADVTDATNVNAAGATMNTDSDVSGTSWIVDEDNMVSDLATKVPTQQSVKAYADTMLPLAGGTVTGTVVMAENSNIALDPALSADGKYTGITITGTAGAILAFGDCVYLAVADSKWELARGNAEATISPMTGIVCVAAAEDATATILLIGNIRADAAFPALTVAAPVFIDPDTAGDVSSTELTTGEFQKCIGWALDANTVVLTGNPDWVKVG